MSTETQIQPSTPRRVKFPQPEFSRSFKSSPAASTAHHGGRGSRKRSKKRLSGADFLDLEAVVNSDEEEEEEDEGEDGSMVATFICPLDVIKTRLQVHGMLTGQREDGGKLSIGENMIAAVGAATAISTNPLWVVKTRLQLTRRGGTLMRDITNVKATIQLGSMESTKRKFTYSEILKITNNFERILGKGGFGTVYHGYLDKTQVAIKMLSPSAVQGFQQFHAEVDLLMRVHHKNLTNLVGYCNDKTRVGLVYEYMCNGNLQEHLSDSSSNILTWKERLRIAIDAAQGLEYLHYGCKPPIIHRDIKSTNILLNENLQAKLSDFGLSKIFPTNDGTHGSHVSTLVAGTPGYLDPEYYLSSRLNEKSDVYSFGIVLLEIITSRPVLSKLQERIHISQWVGFMLEKGDIFSIVDSRLKENFHANSVWKAVEIAMACVSPNVIDRPIMSEVIVELKESLATELALTKQSHETESRISIEFMSNDSIAMLSPSVR
ncbi:hypothetical protein ABKV19_009160 [Rosa sericea]